jgi:hypothetical protein
MAGAPVCFDSLGPAQVAPDIEALVTTADVTFQFPNTAADHFQIHYAVDGGDPVTVSVTPQPKSKPTLTTTLTLPRGRIVWWFTDQDPPLSCPIIQSTIYAFDHAAGAPLVRRRSVRH